jgi:hypothetical protein
MTEEDLPLDDDAFNFFNSIKKASREKMMDMVYEAIVNKTQDALKSSSTIEQKIEAISFIINWFETKEEYEKCLELKKIIKELESC